MSFRINKCDFLEVAFDENEDQAVKRAVIALKSDLRKVLDCLIEQPSQLPGKTIVIKTCPEDFGKDAKKEQFLVEVSEGKLYVKGADRRGTIYGIYWFSENILGVSPWTFFADVPVAAKSFIELEEGFKYSDYPMVEYRGIFINDEEELEHFVQRYMGEATLGVKTYEKIFELLLRLGLNYLWPAMHVNSFNIKEENGRLADSMGIVIGTSHCDMLMRSNNREWKPWLEKKGYENVEYDFSVPGRNREILEEYWRESVRQNKDFEVSWTLGMRGIHDSGFEVRSLEGLEGQELLRAKIDLLEQVMDTQQRILDEEIPEGKEIQKNFVPYKEVLELYDNGLKVPEDMTLIWVNDNYGNVRRYPSEEAKKRRGGNGLYYHNSYWASPGASYLFLNSIPMAKTRNELKKAYQEGIRKLWVTNFGAIKPLEQQLSFYARTAWEGAGAKENSLCEDETAWLRIWLCRTFPELYKITDTLKFAKMLIAFDQLSDARKVEFYDSNVIPLRNDVALYRLKMLSQMARKAEAVYGALSKEYKDAFFELVLMRLQATFFTAGMYYFADKSAEPGEEAPASHTIESRKFDLARRELLYYYNHVLQGGKWNGILTPEDFPPPRTALFPATNPLSTGSFSAKKAAGKLALNPLVLEAQDSSTTGDWHIIKNLGWAYGDLLETYGEDGLAKYSFSHKGGDILLTLHRAPTLNSVGTIRVGVTLDDGDELILESESNDEKRGNWKENILNGVEVLRIRTKLATDGAHTLKIRPIDKYFAFSRIAIYSEEETYGLSEADLRWPGGIPEYMLKDCWDAQFRVDPYGFGQFLADDVSFVKRIPPRPILTYPFETKTDTLALEDRFEYPDKKDFSLDEETLLNVCKSLREERMAQEKDGCIKFFAGSFEENSGFDYCTGQELQGNSLALLIRDSAASFEERRAPWANYKFQAEGGNYQLYAKVYVWSNQELDFKIDVDDNHFRISPKDGSKHPWKYSSEHVWKWIPISRLQLSEGSHTLTFKAYHGGLRVEAFKLEK